MNKPTANKLNAIDFGRVAVLMGGWSSEREVSLKSGAAVLNALLSIGVDAFAIDADDESKIFEQLQAQHIDIVFNVMHGGMGENGTLIATLNMLNIPCVGSCMEAAALAMNKAHCKLLWRSVGLPSAPFIVLNAKSNWHEVATKLNLPLMVKPGREGSSIGMTKVETADELHAAYDLASQFDSLVIAEKWLSGREFTVAILGEQILPSIQLKTTRDFYDYQAKYLDDNTSYLIPSELSIPQENKIQEISKQAFDIIGCDGLGRVDLMEDETGNLQLLEVNTVPGMTDHSLVPMAAKAIGMSFNDLVLQILNITVMKRNEVIND